MSTKEKKSNPPITGSGKQNTSLNFLWGPTVAGVIIAYLLYHRDYFLSNDPPRKLTPEEKEMWKEALVEERVHFHERICSPSSSTCFRIQDIAYTIDEKLVIQRNMMIGDTPYSFSAAFLTVPTDIDQFNMDISKWKINKGDLVSSYAKVMVAFTLVMEGLAYTSSSIQDVLMIGLGGGVISNFLSTVESAELNITTIELDPTVRTIAAKWFHHEENDRNRVLIGDGTVFIMQEAEKGTKYKSIFLDACYTVCPAAVFLEEDVVKGTSRILDDKGVLAINVLTEMDKRKEQSQHVFESYKPHFASCFFFYVKSQQILLCSHRYNWTLDEQNSLFMKKLEEVDRHFNFGFASWT
ncbi:hypothetical protein RB195_021534 [Necator americanus]